MKKRNSSEEREEREEREKRGKRGERREEREEREKRGERREEREERGKREERKERKFQRVWKTCYLHFALSSSEVFWVACTNVKLSEVLFIARTAFLAVYVSMQFEQLFFSQVCSHVKSINVCRNHC